MSTIPAVDRETVMARARDAALSRTKFVEALIDAAQASADARETVEVASRAADRADAEHAHAYKDALDAGWTAAELTGSGLTAPTPVGKKNTKARKRATGRAAPRRRVGAERSPVAEPQSETASPAGGDSAEQQLPSPPAH